MRFTSRLLKLAFTPPKSIQPGCTVSQDDEEATDFENRFPIGPLPLFGGSLVADRILYINPYSKVITVETVLETRKIQTKHWTDPVPSTCTLFTRITITPPDGFTVMEYMNELEQVPNFSWLKGALEEGALHTIQSHDALDEQETYNLFYLKDHLIKYEDDLDPRLLKALRHIKNPRSGADDEIPF